MSKEFESLKPKDIQQVKTEIIRGENCDLKDLAVKYATDFWAGAWKELLVDSKGNQYGTYDQRGNIYPETIAILIENNMSIQGSWPLRLWSRAGESRLFLNGLPLMQFWTIDKANEELQKFLTDSNNGGYGGEILLLKNFENQVVGFTAYTVNKDPAVGRALAQKRFSYQKLILSGTKEITEITLENLLEKLFPDKKIGLYLDFAISESERGKGLGSNLFDARIDNLLALGAEVVVGRTIKTSPAQYNGNYVARGMKPIAYDSENPDKAIFAVAKEKIKERGNK